MIHSMLPIYVPVVDENEYTYKLDYEFNHILDRRIQLKPRRLTKIVCKRHFQLNSLELGHLYLGNIFKIFFFFENTNQQ